MIWKGMETGAVLLDWRGIRGALEGRMRQEISFSNPSYSTLARRPGVWAKSGWTKFVKHACQYRSVRRISITCLASPVLHTLRLSF